MKLTRNILNKIIKEELEQMMQETGSPVMDKLGPVLDQFPEMKAALAGKEQELNQSFEKAKTMSSPLEEGGFKQEVKDFAKRFAYHALTKGVPFAAVVAAVAASQGVSEEVARDVVMMLAATVPGVSAIAAAGGIGDSSKKPPMQERKKK